MKKILALILLFVLSGTGQAQQAKAIANFSGHWIATDGKVSSNIGLNSNCSRVEILIQQSETEILTQVYNAECNLFGSKWGPIRQQIRDGKVYEQDEEVGTISTDTMITISASGTSKYAYNLKLVQNADGTKSLKSYYGTQGAIGAIATEATHHLVP